MKWNVMLPILICLLHTQPLFASEEKFSGQIFGDIFWNATHHETTIESLNGFRFQRMYFTYDNKLNETFSIRLRLDAKSSGNYNKASMVPYMRDVYLQWNIKRHSIILGLSPTPTLEFANKAWGYRPVEKSIVILQRLGYPRDIGIAMKGSFDKSGRMQYHVMIANGNSFQSENNKGKKAMAAFTAEVVPNLFIQGYGDYNMQPGEKYRYTSQLIIAYLHTTFRAGFQLAQQNWKEKNANNTQNIKLASFSVSTQLLKKLWGFARIDRTFSPNPEGEKIAYIPFANAKSTFLITGLDIFLDKKVRLIPNVESIVYDKADGIKYKSDLIPRMTLLFNW